MKKQKILAFFLSLSILLGICTLFVPTSVMADEEENITVDLSEDELSLPGAMEVAEEEDKSEAAISEENPDEEGSTEDILSKDLPVPIPLEAPPLEEEEARSENLAEEVENDSNIAKSRRGAQTFSLYKNGTQIGDFSTMTQVVNVIVADGSSDAWKIVVNQDTEMTETANFAGITGTVTITSAEGQLCTIKGNIAQTILNETPNMFVVNVNNTVMLENITIDGNNVCRHFKIDSGSLTVGDGVMLTGGQTKSLDISESSGGSIHASGNATITVDGGKFENNAVAAAGNGGAIYAEGSATVKVNNGIFTVNYGDGGYNGGAIYAQDNAIVTITGGEFKDNGWSNLGGSIAQWGGAICVQSVGKLTVRNVSFEGNKANIGGAIYSSVEGSITKATFQNNIATHKGGAIHHEGTNKLTINSSTFSLNNTIYDDGGAISVGDGASLEITESEFSANKSNRFGGAIFTQGQASLTKVKFLSNTASYYGGAIHVYDGSGQQAELNANDCAFSGNTVTNSSGCGGAIYLDNNLAQPQLITDCKFKENGISAGQRIPFGGGIFLGIKCKLEVDGSTFEANQANNGGAIYCYTDSQLTTKNTTFSKNQAENGGAISATAGTKITAAKSTFADNTADFGGAIVCHGTTTIDESTSFTGNIAKKKGGAIYTTSDTTIIAPTTFSTNHAKNGHGGAIYIKSGSLKIEDNNGATTLLEENQAALGGAIYSESGSLSLVSAKFSKNEAQAGGALSIQGGNQEAVKVGQSSFSENTAIYGGGICIMSDAILKISESDFSNNIAEQGGAIIAANSDNLDSQKSKLAISTTTFSNNESNIGGAICTFFPTEIVGVTFDNNKATLDTNNSEPTGLGGAVYSESTKMIVSGSSKFTNNAAAAEGGAIFVSDYSYQDPADMTKYQSLETDNTTVFQGNKAGADPFDPPQNYAQFSNLQFDKANSDVKHGILTNESLLNNYDINYKNSNEYVSIIFDANGGIFADGSDKVSQRYVKGKTITIPDGPVREGYKFLYWKGSEYYPGDEYKVDGDHTFTAMWEVKSTPNQPTPPQEPVVDIPIPQSPSSIQVSSPIVYKTIEGGQPAEVATFTFRLEALSYKPLSGFEFMTLNHTPMPEDSVGTIKDIQIKGEGTESFGLLTYNQPGYYEYQIREVPSTLANYVFSQDVYVFTDYVHLKDGELVSERTMQKNGQDVNLITAYFTNQYIGEGATIPDEEVTQLPATGHLDSIPMGLALISLGLLLVMQKKRFS